MFENNDVTSSSEIDSSSIVFDPIDLLNTNFEPSELSLPLDFEIAQLELIESEPEADHELFTPGELSLINLDVNGMERSYEIYVPEGHEGPMPVMYVFHGLIDKNPEGLMAAETDMNRYAEENGFIAVYPLAHAGEDGFYSWNSAGAGLTDTDPSYDDVDYVQEVVNSLTEDLGLDIDTRDQILAGFSEGGEFVHHLAGEMPGVFTDRASVHGTLLGTETRSIEGMPTLIIHGDEDYMLPYDGGMGFMSRGANIATFGDLSRIRDSQPSLQSQWAQEANGCEGEPEISINSINEYIDSFMPLGIEHTFTRAENTDESCNGNPVVVYQISPGMHAWHGVGEGGIPFGMKNPFFNVSEAIVDELLGY